MKPDSLEQQVHVVGEGRVLLLLAGKGEHGRQLASVQGELAGC